MKLLPIFVSVLRHDQTCHCREFANIEKDRESIFSADSTNETEMLAIARLTMGKEKDANAWDTSDGDAHVKTSSSFSAIYAFSAKRKY